MFSGRVKSVGVAATALALALLAMPAQAQFGGLFGGSRNQTSRSDRTT